MDTRTFEGNFYEIGRQQGEIYQANGMTMDHIKVDQELYDNQLHIYEKFYPEYLQQIRGMAEGGKFDLQKLIYSGITGELFFFKNMLGLGRACTIFGCKSEAGLIVGRNYDWMPFSSDLFALYTVLNPDRNAFIAATDYGIVDPSMTAPQYRSFFPEDIINDKGLFVGITFSFADQWTYGISSVHLIKLIAETCQTVDEALAVFERVPLCCPKKFFIADRQGNMVTVEHTAKRFRLVHPTDNVLVQTNHYVDPELAQIDTVLKRMPFHNTYVRYYETLQRINFLRYFMKEKITMDSVLKILDDPATYTCQNLPDIATIWTLAMDMTNMDYKFYWDILKEKKKSMELKF